MKVVIDWHGAQRLRDGRRENLIYTVNLDKIPREPGIYIFARKYARRTEALYVGKANRLRGRIKGQLNHLKLMQYIKNSKDGRRVVLFGRVRPRPGQRLEKVLKVAEKAVIRHFLAEGHSIVNKQGVRIRRHELESRGRQPKKFVPRQMFLEKSKGE